MFLSALIPLLVPPSGEKLLVVAPVFAQELVSPAIPETVIHLKECFRVGLLNASRDHFLKVTGMRPFPFPEKVRQNWNIAGQDFTEKRLFNLWLHRLLARAEALQDDASSDESHGVFRRGLLLSVVRCFHADYCRFCVERRMPPVGRDSFVNMFMLAVRPRTHGMSLRECRRSYEDTLGRRVHWPEVQKTPRRNGWEVLCEPVFFEESQSHILAVDESLVPSDDFSDDWETMSSFE